MLKNSYNLSNKVALVTGASSGIGFSTALALAEGGAKVSLGYYNNEIGAEGARQRIIEAGGYAMIVQADVRQDVGIKKLYEQTISKLGPIDVLINNAGSLIERLSLADLTQERWDEAFALNVKSAFFLAQAVASGMIERRSGAIINIASLAGRNGGALGSIHYASAKAAMITMTKGLAKELAPYNIRVNAVSPGIIATPFHEQFSTPTAINNFISAIPVGRMGTPEEVAHVVCFLASEAASYLCGETIEVNGGLLML